MKKILFNLLLGAAFLPAAAYASPHYQPYSVDTLAGIHPGDADGNGDAARFAYPTNVATDASGNVYVSDYRNHTIRKITPDGQVRTFAGAPERFGRIDGRGRGARFYYPAGLEVDKMGNVYVADSGNCIIRKITPAGVVSTIAGSAGECGSADGKGSAARFNFPYGVAVDGAGSVYVADTFNSTIRKIAPDGNVTTVAGASGENGKSDGTGKAARFFYPYDVTVSSAGNVYVADTYNSAVRKITPDHRVTTLPDPQQRLKFSYPQGLTVDDAENIYVAAFDRQDIIKFGVHGRATIFAGAHFAVGSRNGRRHHARFYYPSDVASDSAGNLYVADFDNCVIRKIGPGGMVTTFAGLVSPGSDNGGVEAARFDAPYDVAVNRRGTVFVADFLNAVIRKVTPNGVVSTLAGMADTAGSSDGAGSAARFVAPSGVAVSSSGILYVADKYSNTIRKVTAGGVVTTFAGSAGENGSVDGTGAAARFNLPNGVAVDNAGSVYVADTYNQTIRKITPEGVVSTLAGSPGQSGSDDGAGSAARFAHPEHVAVDSVGNVYVADNENSTIRKITPAGVVTTLAGLAGSPGNSDGVGTEARFEDPWGVSVDSADDIYVADTGNRTIRRITPAGVVTTLAGLANRDGMNDRTGKHARFAFPRGLAVDANGKLYIADSDNNSIRTATPALARSIDNDDEEEIMPLQDSSESVGAPRVPTLLTPVP